MSEASVANSELKLEGQKRKAPEDGEQGGTPEKVARDTVTNERWIQNWKRKFTPFHEGVPNKVLLRHLGSLICARPDVTVFFPLCGKAFDMKFLYDIGHSVVGVEVAEQAVREFFDENNLSFSTHKVTNAEGTLFKSADGRIRLYCMDYYAFTSDIEGNFGGVWDRGGLVAINKDDQQKYVDHTLTLLADDCRFLLHTLVYDDKKKPGPPHHMPDDLVRQLFGESCDVTSVDLADDVRTNIAERLGEPVREGLCIITKK